MNNVQMDLKEVSLLPNGLPPQFNKTSTMPPTPVQFNGTGSSQSSRTSSPANRLTHIPASQLPPTRSVLPNSQVPQSASVNHQLTQNLSHLSITTPTASPNKQNFNTSTPLLTHTKQDYCSEQTAISPISTSAVTSQFTHSTQSYFTSVVSNSNTQTTLTNVPLRSDSQIVHSQSIIAPSRDSNSLVNQKLVTDAKQNDRNRNIIGTFPQKPAAPSNTLQNLQMPPAFVNRPAPQNQNVLQYPHQQLPIQNSNSSSALHDNKAPTQLTFQHNSTTPFGQNAAYTDLSSVAKQTQQFTNSGSSFPPPTQLISHENRIQQPMMMMQGYNSSVSNSNRNQVFTQPTPQQSSGSLVPPPQQNIQFASSNNIARQAPQLANSTALLPPPSTLVTQENRVQQQPMMIQPPPPQLLNNVQPPKMSVHSNRYPAVSQYSNVPNLPVQSTLSVSQSQMQSTNYQNNQNQFGGNYGNSNMNYQQSNIVNSGYDRAWGRESCDLLQCMNVLPLEKLEAPRINLGQALLDSSNCSPDIFRCTMTKIPDTNSLLQKSRLPLGVLIHPFKDLDHLPVIQCSTIVRCRACRTYINPFVYFVDTKRWKCNLCYRVNELPEEFQFDPVSKTYGDPSRRPEIKSSTIEYIAPSEYMLRPPQPAVYVFLLDVSHAAVESGYLHVFCDVLSSSLSNLPGDARTQVGFIAYNSALHFYSLAEGLTQPHEMSVLDIDDMFLPRPDNLIVNLNERKELISDLLAQLPTRFNSSFDTGSALGAALQAAHRMISNTGGRITVFQATLPTVGPGALLPREDPSQRASAEVQHLNPANDFYKRLALDCSGQQIAVDLFIVNSQYVDLATISGISRFSGGCIHHFPLFKASRTLHAEKLERCFKRYLTRKIGFEAVMRIRCTRGLSIHTFHGNFFVRSTDLLSLPNINPEAGFGMQVSIEESLSDISSVCFQAALLYTSSKGERRIRVHTLCVPIASTLSDIIHSADQQCVIGLLAKMAVDRSMSSLSDAREAFINVAIDILTSYKLSLNLGSPPSGLLAPGCLRLLPLYISALLKYVAFRTGTSTRLDDRVKAMCDMKTLPLSMLLQSVYPDLYPVHDLENQNTFLNAEGEAVPQPPLLQLTARCLDSKGAFLMDMGEQMVLLVCPNVPQVFFQEVLGVPDYNSISEEMYELPALSNPHNQKLYNFITSLNDEKPYVASLHIIKDNSPNRHVFIERLIEDRVENALSYHEFLQHLKTQVK